MNIRPLADRLIVKRKPVERYTAGGLHIPETATKKPFEGTVVAVGNGKILANGAVQPIAVKVGDLVLWQRHEGEMVKVGDEEHVVLREEDLIGVYE